jgi:uncharacterized protein YidB (DUF937 family)
MSLFDSIVNETREKFNLGDKANVLLSVLLAKMTDKSRGGFSGFLGNFERAGLSGLVSSWISSGANTSISNEQLESALGKEEIQEIADKAGTDYQTAISATAFMLPHVVDNLTPDGTLPDENNLLSQTGGYLTADENSFAGVSAGNAFDRVGTSATNVVDADRVGVRGRTETVNATGTIGARANTEIGDINDYENNDNSPLKWLLPLLILALLVIIGYSFCSKPEEHKTNETNINADKNVSLRI